MLTADAATFAEAVQKIDRDLRGEIERLQPSRNQTAQLTAGDSLVLPPEVTCYLDRLRQLGASERIVAGERNGWILVAARWPDQVREWIPGKLAELEDPRMIRLYRIFSELSESDEDGHDPRLEEAADILADLLERAYAAGESYPAEGERDDLPFDLMDALAVESDPRMERLLTLVRERGWAGWTRLERLGGTPPPAAPSR